MLIICSLVFLHCILITETGLIICLLNEYYFPYKFYGVNAGYCPCQMVISKYFKRMPLCLDSFFPIYTHYVWLMVRLCFIARQMRSSGILITLWPDIILTQWIHFGETAGNTQCSKTLWKQTPTWLDMDWHICRAWPIAQLPDFSRCQLSRLWEQPMMRPIVNVTDCLLKCLVYRGVGTWKEGKFIKINHHIQPRHGIMIIGPKR